MKFKLDPVGPTLRYEVIAYHVFQFGSLLNIVWSDDGNN